MSESHVRPHDHLKTVAVFTAVFSPAECLRLTRLPLPSLDAEVDSPRGRVDYGLRRTKDQTVPGTPEHVWIYQRLGSLVSRLNPDVFRFQLQKVMTVQVLEYSPDGFFDWHIDIGAGGPESTRKLSMVTFLTPPGEYEGGALCFLSAEPMKGEQGTTAIFPSYLPHKVERVTQGTRFSLVSWVHGPPFC